MRLLITGADGRLGLLAARHLAGGHDVRMCGLAPAAPAGAAGSCTCVDLRQESAAAALVAGVDAILHFAEYDPAPRSGPQAELDLLEHASLGTYRLCAAARAAGVERIIVASTLAFFDSLPENYLIDEYWRPRPTSDPRQLAPYLAELTAREFAREGPTNMVCLRFGEMEAKKRRSDGATKEAEGLGKAAALTTKADVTQAIDKALAAEFTVPGYRWRVYHITSSPKFILRNARLELGFVGKESC